LLGDAHPLSRDRVGCANIVQRAEADAPGEDTMTTTRYLSVVAILCGLLGCAPVAAAVTQRAMLKKFRSARFSVPGRSAPTVWSNSFCSLVA